jgi:hypothetical protein
VESNNVGTALKWHFVESNNVGNAKKWHFGKITQIKKKNNITWNHLNAPKILIKTKLAWMSFYGINVYSCIIVFISQCY